MSATEDESIETILPASTSDASTPTVVNMESVTENKTSLVHNPLMNMTNEEIIKDIDIFVEKHDLIQYAEVFRKGGLVAKTQHIADGFESVDELNQEDKKMLRFESRSRWKSSPPRLYLLAALCAGCAVVQGMDQTVINGAQVCPYHMFEVILDSKLT